MINGRYFPPEISFQHPSSLPAGQLVCITQDYAPTANGIPRIGPALAVGRMELPSHLVEGGTKGKALTLLHAWKDQLWTMGGQEKPPRARLLNGEPNEEEDTDEEWTGEEIEAVAETQPENVDDSGTPKELSPEGVYPYWVEWKWQLKYRRGI